MMRLVLIMLACAICAGAVAQSGAPIYRSVMPDGKIVFGDKPAPGAKESKPVVLRPSNTALPGPTSSGDSASRQQALENATNDVQTAQQNLDRARAALEAARPPGPDEQIGSVKSGKGGSGGMRTTEAYDKRIKALELDVITAQKQLDEAQARRNDAR